MLTRQHSRKCRAAKAVFRAWRSPTIRSTGQLVKRRRKGRAFDERPRRRHGMTMHDLTGRGMTRAQASASKPRGRAWPHAPWLSAAIVIVASFMLMACGGGDGATIPAGETVAAGVRGSAGLNALVRITAELAGSHCLAGGNRI